MPFAFTRFNDSDDFDRIYNYLTIDSTNKYYVNKMQHLIRPFLIRRIKAHVEKSILPKKEHILFHGMSAMQTHWYKNLVMRNFEQFEKIPNTMLIQLRKVCCHP
jgi:SWI/SNF-related matrix-associated actin-dependent regulator of chromatin subfamily A member 5